MSNIIKKSVFIFYLSIIFLLPFIINLSDKNLYADTGNKSVPSTSSNSQDSSTKIQGINTVLGNYGLNISDNDVTALLNLLKDANKTAEVIKILENNKISSDSQLNQPEDYDANKALFIAVQKVIQSYIINPISNLAYYTPYVLKQDILLVGDKFSSILSVIVLLLSSIVIFFILEKIISRYVSIRPISTQMGASFTSVGQNNSFWMIILQGFCRKIWNIIKVILPSFLAFILLIGSLFALGLIEENVVLEMVEVILVFRVIYLIFGHITKDKNLVGYKPLILHLILLFYLFTLFFFIENAIAIIKGDTLESSLLLRLNMLVFMIVTTIQLVRLRTDLTVFIAKNKKVQHAIKVLLYKRYYFSILLVFILISILSILGDNFLASYQYIVKMLQSLSAIGVFAISAKILSYYALKWFINYPQSNLDKLSKANPGLRPVCSCLSLSKFHNVFSVTIGIISVYYYLYSLDIIWDTTAFYHKLGSILQIPYIRAVLVMYIAVMFMVMLYMLCTVLLQIKINRIIKSKDILKIKQYISLYVLVQKPYWLVTIFVVIWVLLVSVHISVSAILTSTGLVALALAYGAKNIIQNFLNSVICILENSFSLGDHIEAGGKSGTVEDISLIYLKLRDIDGKIFMIPFSQISVVTNYNRDYGYAVVDLFIRYSTDIDKVKDIVKSCVDKIKQQPEFSPLIKGSLEITGVVDLTASNILLRFRIKTKSGKQGRIKSEISEEIQKELKKQNMEL